MAEPLPKYDEPPVVETAMGVIFDRLAGYSTALTGWFWKSYLPDIGELKWKKITETPRLDDRFEKFGERDVWGQFGFRMTTNTEPQRTQFTQENEERMVQIQDSRFNLNWRKQGGRYPGYSVLSKDFHRVFVPFQKFVNEAGLGEINPTQWELVYINKFLQGDLLTTVREWQKIIPKLVLPPAVGVEPTPEPLHLEWRFDFPENRGRLYVTLQNTRPNPMAWQENFLQLTFTARGPVDTQKSWTLEDGFRLGHETIVHTFTAMTSDGAQKLWRRTQ